jgi:serine phosphatase RsbU (regulator of sigma subunit)
MTHSRVLVVEDHPLSRKMLESMLLKSYEVMSAESGMQAIEIAQNKKPDLVLLDIEMPGLDGFQTLEILKNGIIDQATPVIFLTAREDSQSREKGLEAGAVDYITKPYDKQELSIKVKNHLALYEARKEIEARNRVMAREMEMASQLQSSLLPQELPRLQKLSLSACYKPVSEAGGDFYDTIELPDNRIGFVQVDVSGHGVASAMVGAMFKMAFHSFARLTVSTAGLLKVINDEMYKVLPDSDFLTVFYGIINVDTLELTFTNAGHPKPLLFRSADRSIMELYEGGPLVGAFNGMEYDEEVVQLASGDSLLVFTDGVTESLKIDEANSQNVYYGEERLAEVFRNIQGLQDDQAIALIMNDLETFRGSTAFDDDISLLMVSVH